MAFVHGVEATLSVAGKAIEGYMTGIDASFTRAMAELNLLGADSTVRLPGLRSFTFNGNGAWDATVDAALYGLFNSSAAGAVVFSPDGGTTTYTLNCWIPQYDISTPADNYASWSVQLASTGDCVRA